ncbi:Bax inhibitor-1 family protein [bacterium endosymbiont of Pedicinus badii]|uniref:Bax inhibitor-1 family protein n=1 Tax=bacterium endosymbiont of Pedicinus badii TaxID=1719126 RepID=UPI0009BA24A4|nr:Bax inhibitor-1 family protein [bacterium endosymbiont of Pedicinus badii]OQM34355.1 hypothetical protein AOQ89_00460 [bacterium endosymbiont of Pedicinus badii]
MNRIIITSSEKKSTARTNRVLRNTYFLLFLTTLFSALTATLSIFLNLPSPGFLVTIVGFYGLLYLTNKYSETKKGIIATFSLTGFMGYTISPLLKLVFYSNSYEIVLVALFGTALVFLSCSLYLIITKKNMSFLTNTITAGFVVLVVCSLLNLFLHIPIFSLVISGMFIIFSSITMLWEISNIIHRGETNYVRATVNLYVSIYNLFVSITNVLFGWKNN